MHAGTAAADGRYVGANGLEIYYRDVGAGAPLLLLHGGTVSTSTVWDDSPWGWGTHLDRFAQHFRVIAPDTRGHGRTANPTGALHYRLLAEDALALIRALDLKRPFVFGFSDGGIAASLLAMHHPDILRAVVNFAGYDMFNADAPSRRAIRAALGGDPDASTVDPALIKRRFAGTERLRKMQADYDAAQGEGYWLTYFAQFFPMVAVPLVESFADFRRITAPMLILVGDRDEYCLPEEAVTVYRLLPRGELAILPNVAHEMTASVTETALSFLERHTTR